MQEKTNKYETALHLWCIERENPDINARRKIPVESRGGVAVHLLVEEFVIQVGGGRGDVLGLF